MPKASPAGAAARPFAGQPTARNQKAFRVKPDFVFRARKVAVFVDGCFWHGCPLHATQPKTNAAFWRNKISANRTRDRLVTRITHDDFLDPLFAFQIKLR